MVTKDRRDFLKTLAGTAGATLAMNMLPESIRKALAIEANSATGTIKDVEHIVVFMQENRSFDHYLGHLSGVRGYNDRFPVTLPNGLPVWFQPRKEDQTKTIAPFRYDTTQPGVNAQCIGGLPHTWATTHGAINGGKADQWAVQKTNMTMGYHTRADIPFHYALADAFTVCDHYFCSIPGNTHPNRMYLMTGMVDPVSTGGGPLLDNTDYIDNQFDTTQIPPFSWTTYPERLETAGISWRIYQQGTGFDNFTGNYGTNMLSCFANFVNAPVGTPLHDKGMTARTIAQLKADVQANALPQVSWLLPPAAYSEHPRFTPLYGAEYVASILDALTSNPEVWSKTVLFIMYDENDGLFDHMVPPQPPTVAGSGLSTVNIDLERHDHVTATQTTYTADTLPYGLGPRVPMTVVSPWTKGGFVCSQVFDHTSVLQFIEQRFGVMEPNISPWRRAICGDLTAAFNFASPDATLPTLPDTSGYISSADAQCLLTNITAPAAGTQTAILAQETGVRRARAVPYELHVNGQYNPANSKYSISFANSGKQGANFWVYSADPTVAPRRYTVEAGKQLSDAWALDTNSHYQLSVYGPNGYFRRLAGNAVADNTAGAEVVTCYDVSNGNLFLTLHNAGTTALTFTVADQAYGQGSRQHTVAPGASFEDAWDLSCAASWYDLLVTVGGQAGYQRRIAGHVETGAASTSDPAMTAPVLTAI